MELVVVIVIVLVIVVVVCWDIIMMVGCVRSVGLDVRYATLHHVQFVRMVSI